MLSVVIVKFKYPVRVQRQFRQHYTQGRSLDNQKKKTYDNQGVQISSDYLKFSDTR